MFVIRTLIIHTIVHKRGDGLVINCRRCGESMRIATKMDYSYAETIELHLHDVTAQKVYVVCDHCYLGEWMDSRDLQ